MLFGKKKPYGEEGNTHGNPDKKGMTMSVMIGKGEDDDMSGDMKKEAANGIAQMLASDSPPSPDEIEEVFGAFVKACLSKYEKGE